jgi:hypothetical protein
LWTEGGVVKTIDLRYITANGRVDNSHNIGNTAGAHKHEQNKRCDASDACGDDVATRPDFHGMRPWLGVYLLKGGSNNLLYVAYFVVDPDQLDSHKEASYNFEVLKYMLLFAAVVLRKLKGLLRLAPSLQRAHVTS